MSANLSAVPKLQFFDNNGVPLVGGKLYTYAAGTTTPLATYTDASAGTPNTNPIILDSRGEANVWLSATTYKFVLKDSTDVTIWTVDNISNALNLSQILANSGSAASPPYTFASDTTTGMYLAAAGQIGLAVSGVPVIRSTSTTMILGQSGGANDVDVTHYGDTAQTGNFTLTGDVNVTGAAVFNEAGADKDFRVEGDTQPNLLFVDASTDRVGIGTNLPSVKLHVAGAGFVATDISGDSTNETQLRFLLNTSARISQQANQALIFDTNATEKMRIDTSGNVGIGTNSPSSYGKLASIISTAGTSGWFQSNASTSTLVVKDTGANGANISLRGNGATTPDKHIRAIGGVLEVINSAYTANILTLTDAGVLQFNSGYGSVATAYGCRVWVNFDGSGGATIRGSGNVSSVTYGGTGIYTVNFSTAMPDANYSPQASVANRTTAQNAITQFNTPSASSIGMDNYEAGVRRDNSYIFVAVFR
jgi:hypothetical protein